MLETNLSGIITVDPEIDSTQDYSGISLVIREQDDTLFYAVTNREGLFDGRATFSRKDTYLLEVYRNQRLLSDTILVLAPEDAVILEGMLPRFSGHAVIQSAENDALRILNRLERQYGRAYTLAAMGEIPQDSMPGFMAQWGDLFWQLFEAHPETLAGALAAQESFQMLYLDNKAQLMERIRQYGHNVAIQKLAVRYGLMAVLHSDGLDEALIWLDSLESTITEYDIIRRIAQNRIEVLFDSSRTDDARRYLEGFESNFATDPDSKTWQEAIGYDIRYLSPGEPLPAFSLEFIDLDGEREIGLDDLLGGPALIEVVSLADRSYQFNFQELRLIHQLFKDDGVRFLTIPIENSRTALRAFLDEQGHDWPVAEAEAYSASSLEEKWNIYELPVRFLLDEEGKIVRKIYGDNLNEIIIELQTLVTNGEVL